MPYHYVEEVLNSNNPYSDGATVDGGVTAPSEEWSTWKLTGGGFKVTGGAMLERVNNNSPAEPPTGYTDPVGWAVQGKIWVPSGVNNAKVYAYAIFWEPEA